MFYSLHINQRADSHPFPNKKEPRALSMLSMMASLSLQIWVALTHVIYEACVVCYVQTLNTNSAAFWVNDLLVIWQEFDANSFATHGTGGRSTIFSIMKLTNNPAYSSAA